MAAPKRTLARLEEIKRRQWPPRLGADYQAAIRANRTEAPGISSPHILRCDRWGQRQIHLLSTPEFRAGLLALYHPGLFELHEQKVLFPYGQQHPLVDFPQASHQRLKPLLGTVDVVKRLGVSSRHPIILVQTPKGPLYSPFPLIGDLLLFLKTDHLYCVNWSVTLTSADFLRSRHSENPCHAIEAGNQKSVYWRHRIESVYYADSGIRTQMLGADQILDVVFHNLRDLFGSLLVEVDISDYQRFGAADDLCCAVAAREPGYPVIRHFEQKYKLSTAKAIALFKQLIWHRLARVDLFEPIAIDRPLRRETLDVLKVYAHLFAE